MPKKTVNKKKNLLKSSHLGLKRKKSKLLKKGLKTPNKVRKVKRTKGTKRRKRGRKIKTGGAGRPSGRRSMARNWRQSNEWTDPDDARHGRRDKGFQIRGNKRADGFANMRARTSGHGVVGTGHTFEPTAAEALSSDGDVIGNDGDGIANQAEGDMSLIVDDSGGDDGNTNHMPGNDAELEPPGVVLPRIIKELSSDYPKILGEPGELRELERLFEEAVLEEYPITAYFKKLENKFVESSQEELVGASNIQEFATGAAEKAEIIAKLLLKFREKYEGDTTGGDSASATNGEEAYIFTKILSRQDQVYPFDEETYIDKINLSLLQIYIEKIVDKYDLDPGKVEDAGGNESDHMEATGITTTLTDIIGKGVQELLFDCMFDNNSFKDSVKENPDFGSNLNKNLLNLLVLLISYQKKDDIDDIVDIGPADLKYNEKEMITYLNTYSTDLTSAIRLLIKNNGDFDKAMNEYKEILPLNIEPETYAATTTDDMNNSYTASIISSRGGGNKKQKGGAGVVIYYEELFKQIAKAIDLDDFDHDSRHDNLTVTSFSGENKAIKDGIIFKKDESESSLFDKLNENGRFIKVDMKTGISSETPLEGLESINFLVDAGGGFFKGLPDKDPCSSTDSSITTKYISNYTDPASTGKGLLYRCFNEISSSVGGDQTGVNAAINGANIFIKYCLAFTNSIIFNGTDLRSNLDSVGTGEFYKAALDFLDKVTVDAITGDKFKCSYNTNQFDWLGNQSVMANWINDTHETPLAAPRSSVTGGYNDINDAYTQFLTDKGKLLSEKHVYALCRILKYMGDKSHIVAAVLMIKLKRQPFIIQTIDRLLAKCVVQVVEYCRTDSEYQFISQNLGVMLTNARKAPVITHTLACYNDVSGNNECKGTESAIFTYYTSDPVAIKIKWIDLFEKSYQEITRYPFNLPPFDNPTDGKAAAAALADIKTTAALADIKTTAAYASWVAARGLEAISPYTAGAASLADTTLKPENLTSLDEADLQKLIVVIMGNEQYNNYKKKLEEIKLAERIAKITKLSKILPLTFSEGRSGIRLQNGPVVKAHYFTQLSKFNELLSLTLETINEKKEGDIVGLPEIKDKAEQFKTFYDVIYNRLAARQDIRASYNINYDPSNPSLYNLQLQIFQNALGYGRGSQQLPIQVYTVHPGLSGLASSSAKKYAGQVAKSYVDELTSIYELCCKLEQAPAAAGQAGQEGMEM